MKFRAVTFAATLTAALIGAVLTAAPPGRAATSSPKPTFPRFSGLHQLSQSPPPAPIALPNGRRVAPNRASQSPFGAYVGATAWVSGWHANFSPDLCLTAIGAHNGSQAQAADCTYNSGRADQAWD